MHLNRDGQKYKYLVQKIFLRPFLQLLVFALMAPGLAADEKREPSRKQ